MGDDRLDRLEQRMAALERIVRQVLQQGPAPAERDVPTSPPTPSSDPAPRSAPPVDAPKFAPRSRPWMAPLKLPDLERWAGLRGLLAIGVLALIVAAGYLLKLAFDEGWISPVVRSAGGVVVGLLVGVVGFRLNERGLRSYGASLIGTGAAIIYLAMWAAVALYGLIAPLSGIAGLALVSAAVALIASAFEVEALGVAAALGLLFAPVLLGQEIANADLLLAFLVIACGALAFISLRGRPWRWAMVVIVAGYFGLAAFRASGHAHALAVVAYGGLGGLVGLATGLRQRWWETRFLSFSGGWTLVFTGATRVEPEAWGVLGGLALTYPVWRTGLARDPRWPGDGARAVVGEVVYFLLTPLFLALLIGHALPDTFAWRDGVAAAAMALPYLVVGYPRRRVAFIAVGAAAVAFGVLAQFEGLAAARLLILIAVAWAAADHLGQRLDGRWCALGTLALAAVRLLGFDIQVRPATAAFVDGWAITLWALIAAVAVLAAWGWRRVGDATDRGRAFLWAVAGVFLFAGVSDDLVRLFHGMALAPTTAGLASGLAVSAWWLVFAAGLVVAGFRLAVRPLRAVGVVVVFLTLGKVALHDLASLEALYRVGSVFLLGLVSLFLAYLYHRADRAERAAAGVAVGGVGPNGAA